MGVGVSSRKKGTIKEFCKGLFISQNYLSKLPRGYNN